METRELVCIVNPDDTKQSYFAAVHFKPNHPSLLPFRAITGFVCKGRLVKHEAYALDSLLEEMQQRLNVAVNFDVNGGAWRYAMPAAMMVALVFALFVVLA